MPTTLYQEILLDHYRNPRNAGKLENPDFSSGESNPSCGDSILIEGRVKNGILTDIRFQGQGCVLSQATASILTEQCKGKNIDKICALNKEFILNLIGMQLGPNRLQCALLPLEALQKGITKYKKQKKKNGVDHA